MDTTSICGVCRKGRSISRGTLVHYPVLLQSMGYVGYSYAHDKCMLKAQQTALTFRNRLHT